MNPNLLTPQETIKYRDVSSELRCLVCQNQSIADSHASLAIDLKEEIADQVHAGKTKAEIKSYMVDRYGEFVLYKPAYTANNAVLWAGPFVVLVLAAILVRKT
ncbi:MAG TPA: cytochrome c-type biogenesis protein, partial [Limnobacter sp.]